MLLDLITENYPEIKTNFFGYMGKQPVWGNNFENEISKSPMSLNLSRKPYTKYYSSDRISQYLGNGSCIFVDINSKLNDLFTNDEVIFFNSNDLEEFGKKIEYYSNHINEVKKTAKKGWERGHTNYNEKIVTNYFIDIAINNKATTNYSWPLTQYLL